MAKHGLSGGNGDGMNLQATHAELDRRVKELDRRAFLTPAEQAELSQLKKRKLAVKDQIRASQPPDAPQN
jgi:uncharacterized protein YdcH (DUF465 family)